MGADSAIKTLIHYNFLMLAHRHLPINTMLSTLCRITAQKTNIGVPHKGAGHIELERNSGTFPLTENKASECIFCAMKLQMQLNFETI